MCVRTTAHRGPGTGTASGTADDALLLFLFAQERGLADGPEGAGRGAGDATVLRSVRALEGMNVDDFMRGFGSESEGESDDSGSGGDDGGGEAESGSDQSGSEEEAEAEEFSAGSEEEDEEDEDSDEDDMAATKSSLKVFPRFLSSQSHSLRGAWWSLLRTCQPFRPPWRGKRALSVRQQQQQQQQQRRRWRWQGWWWWWWWWWRRRRRGIQAERAVAAAPQCRDALRVGSGRAQGTSAERVGASAAPHLPPRKAPHL